MNKQTILIISDSPMAYSGVGNQVKHISKRLVKEGHTVICLGVLMLARESLPEPMTHTFESGEKVKVIHHNKYDDMQFISSVLKQENITFVILFTDPNKYFNIWLNSNVFNVKNIPIYYISVWDSYQIPHANGKEHYNLPLYECIDGMGCISRQTEWFTHKVFEKLQWGKKPYISYVGHGSDMNVYKPLTKEECMETRNKLFNCKEFDFVVMMANKNQARKKFPDLIEAWTLFMDNLCNNEARDKCALVLHTEANSQFGTDLIAVVQSLAPNYNVYISSEKIDEDTLCKLYNIADVVCNVSNAEGFGLTTNEALLCGTPIVANATGGLIDQIGYFKDGIPITEWSLEFRKNLKEYNNGIWSYPLPNQRTIIGSGPTPYLYDENCSIEDIAKGIRYWYDMSPTERENAGLRGREWCQTMGLNSKDFSIAVVNGIEHTIKNYQVKRLFNSYKV